MVGVPGRSKGCHTCRRRKVKCDERKPGCARCEKAKLTCEGYLKRAVFLNRTSKGLLKRAPLEEIIPNTPTPPSIPLEVNLTPAWRKRIEGYFLENYLASANTSEWPSPGSYVSDAMDLPRNCLLESALEALCLTRVGRITGDDRLLQHGRQAYVIAIKRLHAVLMSHGSAPLPDNTFAAAKIMNVYELYEPTDLTNLAIYNHTLGIANIINSRGVEQHQTKAMRSLLKASRYSAMIAAIKGYSPNSPLASAEWRTTEKKIINDFEQSLYDSGFDLARLIQDMKVLQASDHGRLAILAKLVANSCAIARDIDNWYSDFMAWLPNQPFQDQIMSIPIDLFYTMNIQLEFSHITVAHAMTDFWALRIILNMIIQELSDTINAEPSLILELENAEQTMMLNDHVIMNDSSVNIQLGCNILASFEYCRREEMGSAGSQHIFGVGVALSLFRSLPGPLAEILEKQAVSVIQQMSSNAGLHFARRLVTNSNLMPSVASNSDHVAEPEIVLET